MAWNPRQWWSETRQELEKSSEKGRVAGHAQETGAGVVRAGAGCESCMQSRRAAVAAMGWFMIPSVKEVAEATVDNLLHHERQHGSNPEEEARLARARECTDLGVKAGLKAGSYALVASAIPTLVAARTIPWAKHNLNYTGQALVISAATIAAYFVTTEQTILACSRDASYARLQKEREARGL